MEKTDLIITEPCNVLGIVPVFQNKDDTEPEFIELGKTDDNLSLKTVNGKYKIVDEKLIKFNNCGYELGDSITISNSRYSREFIDKARDTAKVFFPDKPIFYLKWDDKENKYVEHNPYLIAFGKLVFILAPRIDDGEAEEE